MKNKNYYVTIKETLEKTIEVKALNEEEAKTKAKEKYNNEEVILDYNNLIDTSFDIYNVEEQRRCTECKRPMKNGYCIDDGLEYYCSSDCLHKHYTKEEYNKLYNEDRAYYTEWED